MSWLSNALGDAEKAGSQVAAVIPGGDKLDKFNPITGYANPLATTARSDTIKNTFYGQFLPGRMNTPGKGGIFGDTFAEGSRFQKAFVPTQVSNLERGQEANLTAGVNQVTDQPLKVLHTDQLSNAIWNWVFGTKDVTPNNAWGSASDYTKVQAAADNPDVNFTRANDFQKIGDAVAAYEGGGAAAGALGLGGEGANALEKTVGKVGTIVAKGAAAKTDVGGGMQGISDFFPSGTSSTSGNTLMGIGTGASGTSGTGGVSGTGDTTSSILGASSSLYGLYLAYQQQQMAKAAFAGQDPFGSQRPMYQAQLAGLMADPSSIKDQPGYQFTLDQGTQAVTRNMAASGFHGSGNEAIALQNYGAQYAQSYLQQQEQLLAGLSGASIAPNAGPALSGMNMGVNTASSALASLGYGAGNNSTGITGIFTALKGLFGGGASTDVGSTAGSNITDYAADAGSGIDYSSWLGDTGSTAADAGSSIDWSSFGDYFGD